MATIEENILYSIKKNGFPEKKVSLPFQAVFKVCKENGQSISEVLKSLESQEVNSRIQGDKILFFSGSETEEPKQAGKEEFQFSDEMMAEAMEKLNQFDPNELERMKQQVMGMSPEERENLLKQAQDMFAKRKT